MIEQFDSLIFRSNDQGQFWILDQRKIPRKVYVDARDVNVHSGLIEGLGVRGAPALGETIDRHAYSLAARRVSLDTLKAELALLGDARPTAVNLKKETEIMIDGLTSENYSPAKVMARALGRIREAREMDQQIAINGQQFVNNGDVIMSICNTGEFVAGQSAMMVIKRAQELGKNPKVLHWETRPFLQGARLSSVEYKNWGVEFEIIHDSMAGHLMRTERVDSFWAGTDRMVIDGFANKVGTYTAAVLADYHGIPLFVVGPYTSMDRYHKLDEIKIENRGGYEVRNNVRPRIPKTVSVRDLAFDLTPAGLVDHFVINTGVYTPAEYQEVFYQIAPI